MSKSAVEIVLCVISIAALATSIPASRDNDLKKSSDEPPPLWQIDDGQVKVNLGGYHAEAGLGATKFGGGLQASAGTPNAKASAGLGGSLGKDGPTGGLQASASVNPESTYVRDEDDSKDGAKDSQNTNIQTIPRQPGSIFKRNRHQNNQNTGNTRFYAKIDNGSSDTSQTPTRQHGKGTFFDDIFNIPIAALNAVNNLLKNHVG